MVGLSSSSPSAVFASGIRGLASDATMMDPPHVTEFASERYFEKLKQLRESADPADAPPVASPSSSTPSPADAQGVFPQPSFILPIHGSHASPEPSPHIVRPIQSKRPDKPRLFSALRHKVPLLHSRDRLVGSVVAAPSPPAAATEDASATRSSIPFVDLFLSLPNELQVQILSSLPLSDVLNLRRVSKSWHALVTLHEAPIVRYHLDYHVPAYAVRLYPATDAASVDLHYLCGLWHRLHVSAKLAFLICEWITKELFLRTSESQKQGFAEQHERMRRRLIPLLFTIFHFFETYRSMHLERIGKNNGYGLRHEPYTVNPIERQIMSQYDDQTLLRVHQVFPLVIASFCRRLRPPSYVGRVEKSLRGYIRDKPADEVHVAALCVGGLRQVERFWEIKGYNSRRAAVDNWYSSTLKEPVDSPSRHRRGLMGLGRKKSMAFGESARRASDDGSHRVGDALHYAGACEPSAGLVFSTSLSAGMPMGPLSREQLRSLMPDLPVLQQIWLTTAEAIILDRKIVEKASDIKRNQAVMLELIREDGTDEEDEWLYGRSAPDSVRPPVEATEDDPEGVL